jgi:hypothetical protein
VKPCEAPCEKCGSADVSRLFIGENSLVAGNEYGRPPHKWLSGSTYSFRAQRDMIKHSCRTCLYVWVTKPMSKTRAVKETLTAPMEKDRG